MVLVCFPGSLNEYHIMSLVDLTVLYHTTESPPSYPRMTAHEHLNLAAICSPTANVIDVNNFIMQAALSDRVRDHVMAQTGKLARDILDLLYFVGVFPPGYMSYTKC
jgi:hypothetical protein